MQEKYTHLSEEYEEQKNKIREENKKKLDKYVKEIRKIKEEKNNLIKLCTQLKIEINRLENNLSMAQQVIEGEKRFNVNNINKIENGSNYVNNIKNVDDMINEKYVAPEIIKQKAQNDAEILIKEREKNIYKKNNDDKSPKFNGNKQIKKINKSKNKF